MSRSSSPAEHWDDLAAWLSAMTTGFLSKDAGDPKLLTRQELDSNVDQLMSHDPTQAYSSKEWSRIIGSLAHHLVAQARLLEEDNTKLGKEITELKTQLEREIAELKTQLEEACKQKDHTQRRLEDLLLDIETEDETRQELQREVEGLQKALEDLRLDTDKIVEAEKRTTEALNNKLSRAEALLERANIELKDRDTRAKACEKTFAKSPS